MASIFCFVTFNKPFDNKPLVLQENSPVIQHPNYSTNTVANKTLGIYVTQPILASVLNLNHF